MALVAYNPPADIVPAHPTTYRLHFTTLDGVPIRYEPAIVAMDGQRTKVDLIDLQCPAWAPMATTPGSYRWGSTLGIFPASDGCWWYRSPDDAVLLPEAPPNPVVVPLTIRS